MLLSQENMDDSVFMSNSNKCVHSTPLIIILAEFYEDKRLEKGMYLYLVLKILYEKLCIFKKIKFIYLLLLLSVYR